MTQSKSIPKSEFDNYKHTKLQSDIANIHKALVLDIEVKKIPEGTFVREILPILTGEVISAEFPLLMAAVAGSPFAEVDVADAEGNVIFRMPALLERDIVSHQEASKRGSMESMLITAEMVMKQSPKRAEKYLEHELNGRGIAKNRDEIIKRRQERWNAILARYGKSLKADGTVVDGASGAGAEAKDKEKPQLDFEDGDLL
jgi:hypothetical protein